MNKKIVISGTFSVGKTTLLNKLEESGSFEKYSLIREVVRTLAAQGVKINKGADFASQCRILEQHYKNTLFHDYVITDRGAIDAFVFATYDYLKGTYTYQEHKIHEKIFLDTIQYYNVFFYIPVEFDIIDDGFRSLDKQYQKDIDELFKIIYKRYNISYIELKGSVEERYKLFNNHIN